MSCTAAELVLIYVGNSAIRHFRLLSNRVIIQSEFEVNMLKLWKPK